MNFLEGHIERLRARIKKVQSNPDPSRLVRSTLIRYELEIDMRTALLEAFRSGKPLADCQTLLRPLLTAMGFEFLESVRLADRTEGTARSEECMNTVRTLGYPDDACDRTVVALALTASGQIPPPNFTVSMRYACDAYVHTMNAVARHCNIPQFAIDTPLEKGYEAIRYIADQLGELIEYAERHVPGIKYDEDKLIALQEADRVAFGYLHDMYEMRRRRPSPISGQDAFREFYSPSAYPDPSKALEFFRVWRDEIGERAERGLGGVREEKMRLMWAVSAPYDGGVFKLLESRGVSVPWWQNGAYTRYFGARFAVYGDEAEFGRKLSPLEEQARDLYYSTWGGSADMWIEDCLFACRDLELDAVVHLLQWGCTPILGLAKLIEDAFREEGIPFLNVGGRMLENQGRASQDLLDRVDAFVESCLIGRGQR